MYYTLICMDPPWPERGAGRIKRGADRHYDVVPVRELPGVVKDQPLYRPDPRGCLVAIWTTVSHCSRAYWLANVLGLHYATKLYWLKDRNFWTECGDDDCDEDFHVSGIATMCSCGSISVKLSGELGLGQYVRHDVEELLLFRVGALPRRPRLNDRSWILAVPGRHSEKPAAMYRLLERLQAAAGLDGPRAELFARAARPGWDVCGNEVDK